MTEKNAESLGKTPEQSSHSMDLLAGRVDQLIKDKVFPEKRLEVEAELKVVKEKVTAAIENGLFELTKSKRSEGGPSSQSVENIPSISTEDKSQKGDSLDTGNNRANASDDEAESIICLMDSARQNFDKNDLPRTENCIFKINREYSRKVDKAPFRWRFANIYAGYIWVYLVLLLAAIFFILVYCLTVTNTYAESSHVPTITAAIFITFFKAYPTRTPVKKPPPIVAAKELKFSMVILF